MRAPREVEFSELVERFQSKVAVRESGCWEWTGYTDPNNGYGQTSSTLTTGKTQNAHRAVWESLFGASPEASGRRVHLDHLCRNRLCVNPAHMDLVSAGENILRGEGACAHNARKTHCKRGHELTPENVYVPPHRGGRECRECKRMLRRRWKRKVALAPVLEGSGGTR